MSDRSLHVLYVDNHQLVVYKPAGMLTQPSGTEQVSLEGLAKQWIKERYQKSGSVFLEAVHRLDKPVSGIVLFARTSKSLSRLNAFIRNHQTQKCYLATVEGRWQQLSGTLQHYLIHDSHQARLCAPNEPHAKQACLRYEVIAVRDNQTDLKIWLETGRYHQIRIQCAAMGHPILGDAKYGSCIPFVQDGQEEIALKHVLLQIPHPITKAMQTFTFP